MGKHRVKVGIATLALASAGFAAPLATMTSAGATTTSSTYAGLVNVVAKNILNGNKVTILKNVNVGVAAAVCDVSVLVLSRQLDNLGKAYCPALSHNNVVTKVLPA